MSIINDALKKTEQSLKQNALTTGSKPAQVTPAKKKNPLLYVLIIVAVYFCANFFIKMFTRVTQPKPAPIILTQAEPLNPEIKKTAPPAPTALPAQIEPVGQALVEQPLIITPAKEIKLNPEDFTLSGIFVSHAEKYALLNNQILREGEKIKGATVSAITPNSVQLIKDDQSIVISTGNK